MKSIRTKLTGMIFLVIFSFLALIVFNFFYFRTIETTNAEKDKLMTVALENKALQENFAIIRSMDQQYLREPTDEQAEEIKQFVENTIEQVDSYITQLDDQSAFSESFQTMKEQFEKYDKEFATLESLNMEIGYDADSGLRSNLNTATEQLDEAITKIDNVTLKDSFVQLQRGENNYFADQTEGQFIKVMNLLYYLEEEIANASFNEEERNRLLELTSNYETAFKELYGKYEQQERYIALFDEINKVISETVSEMEQKVTEEVDLLTEETKKRISYFQWALIGTSIVLIAFVLIISYIISKNLIISISSVKKGVQKIGNGNFTYRVPIKGKDELAELSVAFNQMAEKVQQSFLTISDSADQIQSSAENLAAYVEQTTAQTEEFGQAIEQVATGANDQTVRIEEGLGLMKNVSESITVTNEKSKQIASDAQQSEKEGQNGLVVIHELEKTNEQFDQLSKSLIAQVGKVSKNFQQITKIVQTIEEIAENTNLLALNAAIESARAGDAGRGFAVVSEEIRKLAVRSKDETREIQQIVERLNEEMSTLTDNTQTFYQYKVTHGKSVNMTRDAFTKIIKLMSNINRQILDISRFIDRMQNMGKEIVDKLDDIHQISEQFGAVAQEVNASSETHMDAIQQVNRAAASLSQISTSLHKEIAQYEIISSTRNHTMSKKPKKKKTLWIFGEKGRGGGNRISLKRWLKRKK
ncbi:methyl-accepting chemotaxis protein [Fervidibacillus albus]|uniref:Methyl-accepting chemotaxis protein n=1 Tax=Fervidibacillus albus TaxID=2980026 RepID=A0A9E8LVY4_9BACI|nr:methyl-accepting chemotaxis protein [Fervidibacillus albus]WAA10091.1 methyl-accepting chemotaxis protein [Fervidibacillus albus]